MAASALTFTFTEGEIASYYATRVPGLKQRRGAQWRGPCPVHQGRDSNFRVDSATGRWSCYSRCGRSGSLIDLEMALTGADFRAALAGVYALVGRPMPNRARIPRNEWRDLQDAHRRYQ